ncbi:hypothetical protein PBNK5_14430 [Pectobacterium brasiliense]
MAEMWFFGGIKRKRHTNMALLHYRAINRVSKNNFPIYSPANLNGVADLKCPEASPE